MDTTKRATWRSLDWAVKVSNITSQGTEWGSKKAPNRDKQMVENGATTILINYLESEAFKEDAKEYCKGLGWIEVSLPKKS